MEPSSTWRTMANGVYVVDPYAFTRVAFIPTGKSAHGTSISRHAADACRTGAKAASRSSTRDAQTGQWEILGGRSRIWSLSADLTIALVVRSHREVYAFDT
jgi:hypothetical protein